MSRVCKTGHQLLPVSFHLAIKKTKNQVCQVKAESRSNFIPHPLTHHPKVQNTLKWPKEHSEGIINKQIHK